MDNTSVVVLGAGLLDDLYSAGYTAIHSPEPHEQLREQPSQGEADAGRGQSTVRNGRTAQ